MNTRKIHAGYDEQAALTRDQFEHEHKCDRCKHTWSVWSDSKDPDQDQHCPVCNLTISSAIRLLAKEQRETITILCEMYKSLESYNKKLLDRIGQLEKIILDREQNQ